MASSSEAKPFIQKLYAMVDDKATANTLGWTADGTAFAVKHMERFVQSMLPVHFKHANLSSFVRQLNTYGFSKVEADAWVFWHPDFCRGQTARLSRIQRKSSHHKPPAKKSTGVSLPLPEGVDDESLVLVSSDEIVHALGGDEAAAATAAGPTAAVSTTELSSMRDRVERLSAEVKRARTQQADTRASIGKIMDFLSQVYQERRAAAMPSLPQLPAPPADEERRAKRMRLDGGLAAGLPMATADGSGAGSAVKLELDPMKLGIEMGHPLSRQPSLGAQVAYSDLRDLALHDELQLAPPAADDVDAYLWDFIEASA